MKYYCKMERGHSAGDAVCFLSACRKFARKTDNTVFVSELSDVVDAYNDSGHLRFGTEGMLFPITCPWEAHRLHEPKDYGNYYGTYLAVMGMHTGGLPHLDLPVFPIGPSYAVIQPFSGFASNPPLDYVQKIVDTFRKITGKELYVVGNIDTPKVLKNVRYDLLSTGISRLMQIIQNADYVLTARSLTAHLAAGYNRPSFVWVPPDGENWYLNYPDWPKDIVSFSEGVDNAVYSLSDHLSSFYGVDIPTSTPITIESDDKKSHPLDNLDEFVLPVVEPMSLPINSVVVETRPDMIDTIRRITLWHRHHFKFAREIVISDVDPHIGGTTFINCGTPPQNRQMFLSWYSDMCIKGLVELCDAPFMLVWQWDGFIVNPELWTNEFLNYDYIGAPLSSPEMEVKIDYLKNNLSDWKGVDLPIIGNGGFSLRSREFLEVSASIPVNGLSRSIEDFYLCVEKKDEMEKRGIKFSPPCLAQRFSEESYSNFLTNHFGFHGVGNGNLAKVKTYLESKYLPK